MSHWRYTFRDPKLGWMDARVGFVILAVLLWPNMWTLLFGFICIAFLTFAAKKGTNADGAFRMIRTAFHGTKRPALPNNKIGKSVDFQSRPTAKEK